MWTRLVSFMGVLLLATGVTSAQDLSVVKTYKTDTPPELDGEIGPGEWDAAGPPIVVAPEADPDGGVGSAFPDEDPFGGPSDLSFQFRTMWVEPWTVYFLFEVTDDIAMEVIPANRWELDQVEFFMDGDHLYGSDDLPTFQWWDNVEIYGKFGGSRWEGEFEGHPEVMSIFPEDFYDEGIGAYAIVVAKETENEADYVVEYAVTLEPMFDNGTFVDTPTEDAAQIVEDVTVVKWTACVSDDDDYGDGTTGRSHTVCYFRDPPDADWRNTEAFADLAFTGEYSAGLLGDYNSNGALDSGDLDLQAEQIVIDPGDPAFDLNGDNVVDFADRQVWINDLKETWMGDANLNCVFDSSDQVQKFVQGKYEKDVDAGWADGDSNGDMRFNSSDMVADFVAGGYELAAKPGCVVEPAVNAAVSAVPEPGGLLLLILGVAGLLAVRRG